MLQKRIISENDQYVIYSDSDRIMVCFQPVDLIRIDEKGLKIINGLEQVYERRKQGYIDNIRRLTEVKRTSSVANCLPDYYDIHEENSILTAESRFFNYEQINMSDENGAFFHKISSVCNFMKCLIDDVHSEPVIDIESIVFEKNMPSSIHLIYADFNLPQENRLCSQLRNIIIQKVCGRNPRFSDSFECNWSADSKYFHPKVSYLTKRLTDILSPVNHRLSDWKDAKEVSDKICGLIDMDPDYFINQYIPFKTSISPVSEKIKDSLENNGHVVFLKSDDKKTLISAVDGYLLDNRKYVHITYGDSISGLEHMIEGKDFCLHSGLKSANERYLSMKKLCSDGMLLIIENCNIEKDDFFRKILRLPADIIFLSENDYSEYGFITITI